MKKTLLMIALSLLTLNSVSQAAPYYAGIGCDEEGLRCTFGKPSGRVLKWSKTGTAQELGQQCEHFLNNIETRKNNIAKEMPLVLKYKNYTYSWSNEVQADGRAKINCNIEIHSELAEVKVQMHKVKDFFWTCDDDRSAGPCAHTMSECERVRDEALSGENVLDSRIYMGGSLLQGRICTVVTARISSAK
jgi:hypothetical protein